MSEQVIVKERDEVIVRFSGDSGDGMQLAGNIFSTISATVGNDICTFPDYPADIRAPQGSLTGVSGFQVHIGAERVYTPGDLCDVLVAMNAAALKTQYRYAKSDATIIIDTDSFGASDLKKAAFETWPRWVSMPTASSHVPLHRWSRTVWPVQVWNPRRCSSAATCLPWDSYAGSSTAT